MDRFNAYLNSLEPGQRAMVIGAIYVVFLGLFGMLMVSASKEESATPQTTTTTTSMVVSTDSIETITTTTEATTTTTEITSTTSSTVTTTTVAGGPVLELRPTGIGESTFGDPVDAVVAALNSYLGPADEDTGWVASSSLGACIGDNVRLVTWGAVQLFFTDGSTDWGTQGVRHFASWSYSPEIGSDKYPAATSQGISLGSTVKDLVMAFGPTVVVNTDEMLGPIFRLNTGGAGFIEGSLTSTLTTGEIVTMYSGNSCMG